MRASHIISFLLMIVIVTILFVFLNPVHAAEAVLTQTPAAVTGVVLPYGSWIAQYGLEVATWAVSALAALAAAAIARLWPMAASILTQQRLQTAGQAIAEYAINAVANSTKDGKVTVNMGSAVVAAAVQRGIDAVPGWVVKKAGGPEGLAAVVFRLLPLEDGANKRNVLDPAIDILKNNGTIK